MRRLLRARALFLLFATATGCSGDAADGNADLATGADCTSPVAPGTTLHEVSFSTSSGERAYLLHVPTRYDCHQPAPLVVDFHGIGGPMPEEQYALDGAIASADRAGYLLLRPRSQGDETHGYRWDASKADIAANLAFVRALVGELSSTYAIDAARVYAFGFSDGTNMASQFLAASPPMFRGYGLVGGGLWQPLSLAPFDAEAPRIWASTGYDDINYPGLTTLAATLQTHAYPQERLFVRETKAGHALYGWHYDEAFSWIDAGHRRAPGTLAGAWTSDGAFPGGDTLLAVRSIGAGVLVATDAAGSVWRKGAAWTKVGAIPATTPALSHLTGLCGDEKQLFAVGAYSVLSSTDGGLAWSALAGVPDFGQLGGPAAYLSGIMCLGDGHALAVGYLTAASTSDGGGSWAARRLGPGQIVALGAAVAASGTTIAVGYPLYIGRGVGGGDLAPVRADGLGYYYDVGVTASGAFWVVGEGGALLSSTDDGLTWKVTPGPMADLYASDFVGDVGIAVGLHGAAWLTTDGGATWVDVDTGRDLLLADVAITDAHHAVAVGEAGTVLTLTF